TLTNQTMNKAMEPGIKDENDFATAGGTESGNSIVQLRATQKRIISLEIMQTTIAVKIPPEPRSAGSMAILSFNIANKNATVGITVPVIVSNLLALADW